jgi:hypothetical protein
MIIETDCDSFLEGMNINVISVIFNVTIVSYNNVTCYHFEAFAIISKLVNFTLTQPVLSITGKKEIPIIHDIYFWYLYP